MVAVAMGSVDRRQFLATRGDPIRKGAGLLDGDEGVDEDSVALADMRVDDMGGQNRCFAPGGRSLVTEGMAGVTKTSHFRGMPRVPTSVMTFSPLLARPWARRVEQDRWTMPGESVRVGLLTSRTPHDMDVSVRRAGPHDVGARLPVCDR